MSEERIQLIILKIEVGTEDYPPEVAANLMKRVYESFRYLETDKVPGYSIKTFCLPNSANRSINVELIYPRLQVITREELEEFLDKTPPQELIDKLKDELGK